MQFVYPLFRLLDRQGCRHMAVPSQKLLYHIVHPSTFSFTELGQVVYLMFSRRPTDKHKYRAQLLRTILFITGE